MENHMDRSIRYWLILAIIIIVAILAAVWASLTVGVLPGFPFEPRPPPGRVTPGDYEFFYTVKTVVSTIDVTLSLILLITYLSIYSKTRSDFTLGLTIFSAVILLNALVSDPLVTYLFGFRAFGLGPFAMLPDLLTLAALSVLLYLSVKY
jgi:hypothetical protein